MTDIGNIRLTVDMETARASRALATSDDVGTIIRIHFLIERAVLKLLEDLSGGAYSPGDQAYLSVHLNRCAELGISEKLLKPLWTINTQRNLFAHKGLEAIKPNMVRKLRRDVAETMPMMLDDNLVFERSGSENFEKPIGACTTKEAYVVTAMAAISLLLTVTAVPEETAII